MAAMTEYLTLKTKDCKNCYKCIRHCPVKSIRFENNQAHIVREECILCGHCFVACPGGCVSGGGQLAAVFSEKEERGWGLYSADRLRGIKRSEENPLMMNLYNGLLKGRVHELLHVNYNWEKTHA
jgi:iron only hydrogenase large subunit-like protein